MFERLENRCMFQVSAVPMTINGTGAGDTIILTQSGNSLVVKKNGVTTTHALSGVTPGATPTSGTPWVVSKVVINGLGGNDKIQAGPSVQKRLEIFGGPGTDTITGGANADLLCGASIKTAAESGNDVINGGADNDEIYASMAPARSTGRRATTRSRRITAPTRSPAGRATTP